MMKTAAFISRNTYIIPSRQWHMYICAMLSAILIVLPPQQSQAQLTLTSAPYTQNFDAIGITLPTGWTVRTGAGTTTLGSTASLVTTKTAWSNTTGQFANFASGNTPSTQGDNVTTQNNRTDRALGLKQTNGFGTPGAAFTLQIANTTGLYNFSASFKLQSLDPNANRTSNWVVDYGFGANPTSFSTLTTAPSTLTTGVSWGTTTVTFNFGTAIDNKAGPVWIRIWNNSANSGGTQPTTAIDDFNLTWNTITTTPAVFGPFCISTTTSSAAFNVAFTSTGTFNSGNIYAAQLSDANGAFSSPITIGTLNSNANSGNIPALIPAGLTGGTGYRIRVIASNPAITGSDNGSDFAINAITSQPLNKTACVLTPTSFSVTTSGTPTYQWEYSADGASGWTPVNNGTIGNVTSSGATTATLTVTGDVPGFYRCAVTYSGCNMYSSAASLNYNQLPALPGGTNTGICGTGSAVLNATPGNNETIDWYDAATSGTLLLSGNPTFITPVISTSTAYYAEARNLSTGCISSSRQVVTATVHTLPPSPAAGNAAQCGAGSLTITATPGTGETIDWYNSATGGTLLLSGNTQYTTPEISSSTNYFATARNTTTGCVSAIRTPVSATINTNPGAPAAISGAACGTNTVSVAATPPSGSTVDWYDAATEGNLLLAGSTGYLTPLISTTTEYFAVSRNTSSGCTSLTRTGVTATINALPSNPPNPTASGDSLCGSSTLFAETAPTGVTFFWQGTNSNGTSTAMNATAPVVVTTSGTYYVRAQQNTTGCWSAGNGAIALTVLEFPVINTHPVSKLIAPLSSATFSVTSPSTTTYIWEYSDDGINNWDTVSNNSPSGITYQGIQSATLTANTDNNATNGTYYYFRCVLNNSGCKTFSNSAILNIESPSPVTWHFENAYFVPTANATKGLPINNLSVSAISQGNNNASNGAPALIDNQFSSSGYNNVSSRYYGQVAAKTSGLNTSPGGSAYFEFTLTPSSGYMVSVGSFSFGSRSLTNGPRNYVIRSSADNYASNIASGSLSNNGVWQLNTPVSTVITGASGTALTFRIYGYSGSGSVTPGIANWFVDDIQVNVSVDPVSAIVNPSRFYSTAFSASRLQVSSSANPSNNRIMIAYSLTNTLGNPVNGVTYKLGDSIPGGGSVIFKGTTGAYGSSTTTMNHGGLLSNTTYFYKAWSYDASNQYSSGVKASATTMLPSYYITELVIPKYIGNKSKSNNDHGRTPFAICLRFDSLLANTEYDIAFGLAETNEVSTSPGGGYQWDGVEFSAEKISKAFKTDATGKTGPTWFYLTPSESAGRFEPGQKMDIRIRLAVTGTSLKSSPDYISDTIFTVLDVSPSEKTDETEDDGAFINGVSSPDFAGKYALIFDNEEGLGGPLFAYQVTPLTAVSKPEDVSHLPPVTKHIYSEIGNTNVGEFPAIVPSALNNPNGIRRVEIRDQNNKMFAVFTTKDGLWDDNNIISDTRLLNRRDEQYVTLLKGIYNKVYINGSPVSQTGDMTVNNILDISTNNALTINGHKLTLNDTITGNGKLTGSVTSDLTISGNTGRPVGTLNFTPGTGSNLDTFTMNRTGIIKRASAILGNSINTESIRLYNGIVSTGNNLLTWEHTNGIMVAPNIAPWSTKQTAFSDSYICTCDSYGNAITPNGNNGFRIKNINDTNNVYFPVGTDFVSANRMMLNNRFGTGSSDFTVVVAKGDIGGTPLPRVSRLWYVSSTGGTPRATMHLFFTKQNWSEKRFAAPNGQDEVEDGFLYDDAHLVQKDYTDLFVNNSLAPVDIYDFSKPEYGYGTEIFAKYSYGVSPDINGGIEGITGFVKFSVVNANSIILPVSVVNLSAYQINNSIQLEWTALNEINVDHYEIEKSNDGVHFALSGKVNAFNNGNPVIKYFNTDNKPFTGDNFYRIRIVDKNGSIHFTPVVLVNMQGGNPVVRFYPNPVQNRNLHIQMNNLRPGRYNFILFNIAGQVMYRQTIEFSGGGSTENILLPQFIKPGVYIARLFNESEKYVSNLIVR